MFALPVSQYISTNINNTKGLSVLQLTFTVTCNTHIYTLYLDMSCYRKIFHQDKIRVFLFLFENYIVSESVTKTKNNGL